MTAGDIGEYANYFVHLAVVNLRHRRQQQNGNKQHCIHCAKSMRMRFKLNYRNNVERTQQIDSHRCSMLVGNIIVHAFKSILFILIY